MGFVPFFLWHSLKGGVDVAWRAFHPRLPITPELIEYPLRLPPGLPRVILVNTVSLLPGTLSAELGGQVLKVHVLDSLGDFLAELETLEQRVGCMFRSASDNFSRR
jgi:multicomponent Na+:H+ antiporter subunit E